MDYETLSEKQEINLCQAPSCALSSRSNTCDGKLCSSCTSSSHFRLFSRLKNTTRNVHFSLGLTFLGWNLNQSTQEVDKKEYVHQEERTMGLPLVSRL